MTNPLFPDEEPEGEQPAGYVLPPKQGMVSPSGYSADDKNAAAEIIRQKVQQIYADEPAATEELTEIEAAKPRSKHQAFMYELSNSGKNLAEIQTAWHNYYLSLPDNEKHQVWQEFYENAEASQYAQHLKHQAGHNTQAALKNEVVTSGRVATPHKRADGRPESAIKATIRDKVTGGGKLKAKHHVQSLLFGLGMGALVIFIFLFGFFNEFFITPFIQPSRTASATPLILSSTTAAVSNTPEVIIPKINVEIPVDYTQTSTDENVIENALMNGIVHYPNTVMPGQNGNAAFFGHSSNNIFNKGKYKFAFALLHELVIGDTFYLTNGGKVYAYKVISRTIVDPSDVSVLGPVDGQTATATLITCDPPGTSLHRLIVVGEQVSPDPTSNTASTTPPAVATPTLLASNGPTLWSRFSGTTSGKVALVAMVGSFALLMRWTWRQW